MKLLCIVNMQQGLLSSEFQPVIVNCEKLSEEFCLRNQTVFCTKLLNNADSPFERFLHWKKLRRNHDQTVFSGISHYANKTFVKYGHSVWTPAFTQAVKNHCIDQIYRTYAKLKRLRNRSHLIQR